LIDAHAPIGLGVTEVGDPAVASPNGGDPTHRRDRHQSALLRIVVDEVQTGAADDPPELGAKLGPTTPFCLPMKLSTRSCANQSMNSPMTPKSSAHQIASQAIAIASPPHTGSPSDITSSSSARFEISSAR